MMRNLHRPFSSIASRIPFALRSKLAEIGGFPCFSNKPSHQRWCVTTRYEQIEGQPMNYYFHQFELWISTFTGRDFFLVLFYTVLAVVAVISWFVATELLNSNLTLWVVKTSKQARESHDKLKDRLAAARKDSSPAFDYDYGDRLLYAVTLCLDDADRKVARAPSHIASYWAARKDVKLALCQLGYVEKLFTYVPSEG
jgi:hypothetical protein